MFIPYKLMKKKIVSYYCQIMAHEVCDATSQNVDLRWSCTKFSPHFKILSFKVKPNMLMSISIVSPLALIVFLKNLMWAWRSISFTYVGYCNFIYNNLLVSSGIITTDGYPYLRVKWWPSICSIKWIKRWSFKWVSIRWSSSKQSSTRWISIGCWCEITFLVVGVASLHHRKVVWWWQVSL